MTHLLLFSSTALLAVAIPGPDFLLIFQTALRKGKLEGIYSAIGIALGLIIHGLFATIGLSALLLKSATAFQIVKYLGAGYLVLLATQLLIDLFKTRKLNTKKEEIVIIESQKSIMQYVLRGFLTNVLNVKAALYFVAIVPQFIVGKNNITAQLAMLSFIQIFVALIWFSLLALSVNKLGIFLKKRVVQRWLDGATATIFLGLASKLASTHRN